MLCKWSVIQKAYCNLKVCNLFGQTEHVAFNALSIQVLGAKWIRPTMLRVVQRF